MTESQTAGLSVRMRGVSCRELEDRCWTNSREAKWSQMGQTLFDELSLSGLKSRLHRGGCVGGVAFRAWDQSGKIKRLFLSLLLMGQ